MFNFGREKLPDIMILGMNEEIREAHLADTGSGGDRFENIWNHQLTGEILHKHHGGANVEGGTSGYDFLYKGYRVSAKAWGSEIEEKTYKKWKKTSDYTIVGTVDTPFAIMFKTNSKYGKRFWDSLVAEDAARAPSKIKKDIERGIENPETTKTRIGITALNKQIYGGQDENKYFLDFALNNASNEEDFDTLWNAYENASWLESSITKSRKAIQNRQNKINDVREQTLQKINMWDFFFDILDMLD